MLSNYTGMRIYHNPRCTKSRQALNLLTESGKSPEIIEYLKTPISESELKSVIDKLGIEPIELVRKGEAIYKEEFKSKDPSTVDWIKAMIDHPKLMERPIVVSGDKAVIGRPPGNVLQL